MDTVLFIVFPYLAVILAVGVGLYRYLTARYTFSSLSSQLLENGTLFWGSVPWHYGITLILLAHFLGWLFPGAATAILGNGVRLFLFEAAGLAVCRLIRPSFRRSAARLVFSLVLRSAYPDPEVVRGLGYHSWPTAVRLSALSAPIVGVTRRA